MAQAFARAQAPHRVLARRGSRPQRRRSPQLLEYAGAARAAVHWCRRLLHRGSGLPGCLPQAERGDHHSGRAWQRCCARCHAPTHPQPPPVPSASFHWRLRHGDAASLRGRAWSRQVRNRAARTRLLCLPAFCSPDPTRARTPFHPHPPTTCWRCSQHSPGGQRRPTGKQQRDGRAGTGKAPRKPLHALPQNRRRGLRHREPRQEGHHHRREPS